MVDDVGNDMAISDLDVGLPDGWYQVDLDEKTGRNWAKLVAEALVTDRSARKALVEDLTQMRDSIRRIGNPAKTAAVWLPSPADSGVEAFLVFTLNELTGADGPDAYLDRLRSDENRAEAGVRYLNVQTWRTDLDSGEIVGAYNLIEHQELGEGFKEQKERTVIGLFPPRSKEMVEFVFSAARIETFDDIIAETMAIVAGVGVELEAL